MSPAWPVCLRRRALPAAAGSSWNQQETSYGIPYPKQVFAPAAAPGPTTFTSASTAAGTSGTRWCSAITCGRMLTPRTCGADLKSGWRAASLTWLTTGRSRHRPGNPHAVSRTLGPRLRLGPGRRSWCSIGERQRIYPRHERACPAAPSIATRLKGRRRLQCPRRLPPSRRSSRRGIARWWDR